MRKIRKCKRFYFDQMKERVCCTDCPQAYHCPNRCLNHPNRCGLVENFAVADKDKQSI